MTIACIFFDGVASRQEPDEYVEIVNTGPTSQDLEGWRLVDVTDDGQAFTFPEIVIPAGGRVRVYTNEIHEEWGGLSFGRGTAIWRNADPDTAGLYDQAGTLVSSKTYPRVAHRHLHNVSVQVHDYAITPCSLPASSNTARARSSCSRVWAADI